MKISIQKCGYSIPVPVCVEIETDLYSADSAAKALALIAAVDNAPPLHTEEPDSSVYRIVAGEVSITAVEGTPGGTAAEQLLHLAMQLTDPTVDAPWKTTRP
jgi:hypothetical protein